MTCVALRGRCGLSRTCAIGAPYQLRVTRELQVPRSWPTRKHDCLENTCAKVQVPSGNSQTKHVSKSRCGFTQSKLILQGGVNFCSTTEVDHGPGAETLKLANGRRSNSELFSLCRKEMHRRILCTTGSGPIRCVFDCNCIMEMTATHKKLCSVFVLSLSEAICAGNLGSCSSCSAALLLCVQSSKRRARHAHTTTAKQICNPEWKIDDVCTNSISTCSQSQRNALVPSLSSRGCISQIYQTPSTLEHPCGLVQWVRRAYPLRTNLGTQLCSISVCP